MSKKVLFELITNRFGIVLAAINGAFFAGRIAQSFRIDHGVGELILICINIPAFLAMLLASGFVQLFFNQNSFIEHRTISTIFFALFLVFQWLLIAHFAKIGANYVKTRWTKS